ncbi:MAG: Origin recognition complex subunit 2 [Watsoniomyces obsoletus]|nr:MAG: Origin recognition complex subunit 2 [Watsoniomyces obsoletus]
MGVQTTPSMKTRRAAKNTTVKLDTKGNLEDTKTFIKPWDNEAKSAAYLGFSDIGQFRKFILSFWPLALIRDVDYERCFPWDGSLRDLYPLQGKRLDDMKKNKDYALAMLLVRMVNAWESAPSTSLSIQEPRQRQGRCPELFKGIDRDIPEFDIETVTMPVLGPRLDLEESHLEKYNPAYTAIRALTVATFDSVWKTRYSGSTNPFSPRSITSDHVPFWMVEKTSLPKPAG